MAVRTLTLRIALIAAVLLLGCLAPAPGPSAPVLVASETASAKAPSKAEKSARDKAAKAAEKFADWCARVGAYDEARRYYSVAAVCTGSIDAYLALFRKIADKPHSPTEMYDKDKAKERAKLWSKGGKPLLDFIKSTWKSLEIDQAREAMAIWSLFFRDDEQLMNSGWRWSERYSLLLPEKDSIKLEMGMIPFRGKWLDKEELEATDGNHSVWKARYKISDGRSLLETPAKLRIAYWAMGLITRFRVFLLAETMLALELKLPEVRQPVWLTRTREEYGERMKALGKERGKEYRVGSENGIYMGQVGAEGCPLIVSMEYQTVDNYSGRSCMYSVSSLMFHELTHQFVTEGRSWKVDGKWNSSPDLPPSNGYWMREGIASYYQMFQPLDGSFELKTSKGYLVNTRDGEGTLLTHARHAKLGLERFKPLAVFANGTRNDFAQGSLDAYGQAVAITMYVLEGDDQSLKTRLLEQCKLVHSFEATETTFSEVFKGVDLKALDKEVRGYVGELEVSEVIRGEQFTDDD